MKTLMTRLILSTALLLAATGCRSVNPRTAMDSPTRLTQSFDDRGRITESTTDNSGRTAAAEGQIVDTNASLLKEFAPKIDQAGNFTYAETVYSMVDEPNVQLIQSLSNKHKDLANEAQKALDAGLQQDYQALMKQAGEIAMQIIEAKKAAANKPKGDKSSISTRVLSSGAEHTTVPLQMAKEFGETMRNRVDHPGTFAATNTTAVEDTSTIEEVRAGLDARVKLAEQLVALKKIEAEISAAAKKSVEQTDGTGATDKPGEPDTPVVNTDGMTPAQRLEAWYPSALHTDAAGFKPDESGLWKPGVGDSPKMQTSNGHLAIHTPHSKLGRVIKIIVDDEASGVGQTGNGGRPLFRFSKAGGAYSGNVSLITDTGTWTAKADNPAARCALDFKLATPATELEPGPVTPDPVTPEPATGDTVPVPEI